MRSAAASYFVGVGMLSGRSHSTVCKLYNIQTFEYCEESAQMLGAFRSRRPRGQFAMRWSFI